jgi:hypothetical protein
MKVTPDQLEPARIEYFEIQKALYETAKPQLIERYLGEFVAFEDGRVLDHDLSEQKLVQRVYQDYGYRDLLIKQVWIEEPHLSVAGVFHSNGED